MNGQENVKACAVPVKSAPSSPDSYFDKENISWNINSDQLNFFNKPYLTHVVSKTEANRS